ncbi:hypothetical protein NDU88_007757 [Pleurodeles waltl]|uniref:Uncharacterized protein n=1 Tax=Pleurodeles waltl TaxID=8319 RepID=A0AAV7NWX3_PLEWA|nr:hypothetical protein NDU88_007757 [Pleurodeles waltl]
MGADDLSLRLPGSAPIPLAPPVSPNPQVRAHLTTAGTAAILHSLPEAVAPKRPLPSPIQSVAERAQP